LYSNTYGSHNVANGFFALHSNTFGFYNTAMGNFSLGYNHEGVGNTAVGYNALLNNSGGSYATAIGYNAMMYANDTGTIINTKNVAVGFEALRGSTDPSANTGIHNTTVGYESLLNITSGNDNAAFGTSALRANNTGNNNTAIGSLALFLNTTGSGNTANGNAALEVNSTGNYNTSIGYHALMINTNGFNNTSVGSFSHIENTTGDYNTALGFNSGPTTGDLDNTICIGTDAAVAATDHARIGNVFVNSIGGQVVWTAFSDGRFKENIEENIPGLEFITKLRPVSYQVNNDKINDFTGINRRIQELGMKDEIPVYQKAPLSEITTGFIAQEVEMAAREIGFDFSGIDAPKNENDMYGLRYAAFVVPLVKAVQELNETNKSLRSDIDELRAEIEELKKMIRE